eukprot:TRINITY_DN18017_c0_g1_i1.p1 TRINITY_DN18017_c0_g1~~TRINITY_DN18017_c0_g1_i1.p1  ORF type:complete len:569 (+),score=127.54 TRINITY_DN18017_c0_g1_i1:75-1781(+)
MTSERAAGWRSKPLFILLRCLLACCAGLDAASDTQLWGSVQAAEGYASQPRSCATTADETCSSEHSEDLLLAAEAVQSGALLQLSRGLHGSAAAGARGASCASLKNMQTYFTAEVQAGTPPQTFDVVADTGSNWLLVASCVCQDQGNCDRHDKCFRGTNRSSTFSLPSLNGQAGNFSSLVLSYGSGEVQAIVASDVVRVGGVQAQMDASLLLMVDKKLDFETAFEGILGLGLPKRRPIEAPEATQLTGLAKYRRGTGMRAVSEMIEEKSFLDEAGIARFSICFNDAAEGALRLNTPEATQKLGSVGSYHWGLDFRGISVGGDGDAIPVGFCESTAMKPGQRSPCGIIPDSGTTMIMAPARHLRMLYKKLCKQWKKCDEAVAALAGEAKAPPEHEVFQALLHECEDWLSDSKGGLNELPPMTFDVMGSAGNAEALTFHGPDYVVEVQEDEVVEVTKDLFGVLPVKVQVATGRKRMVCMPAFSAMGYETEENGPVWILGSPLFYKYEVGYDLSTSPPSMSFRDGGCDTCSGATLVARSERLTHGGNATIGRGRRVRGRPRMPTRGLRRPL